MANMVQENFFRLPPDVLMLPAPLTKKNFDEGGNTVYGQYGENPRHITIFMLIY
jgi:hypothetical protein